MPSPPVPTPWDFDLDRVPAGEDLVGVGADLEVATLYEAYSVGVFPMGIGEYGSEPMGWWSPVFSCWCGAIWPHRASVACGEYLPRSTGTPLP